MVLFNEIGFRKYLRRLKPFSSPLIFDHIFKTAGTSFHHSYLAVAVPDDEKYVIPGQLEENRAGIHYLKSLSPSEKRRINVIAGHNADQVRAVFPRSKYLTLVREPVARTVSAYLHAKLHPDMRDFLDNAIERENINIADFVEEDLLSKRYADFCSVRNYQFRHLCGRSGPRADEEVSRGDLLRAFKKYRLIGVTEEFNSFLGVLHFRHGFPLALFNNRLVIGKKTDFCLTDRDREVILRHNQADRRLYETARERFLIEWDKLRTPTRDSVWRDYLEALENFREQTGGDENQWALFPEVEPRPGA